MQVLAGRPDVTDVDGLVADLNTIGAAHGVAVQAVDARYVAGHEHLASAVDIARRERERGAGIADSLAIDILLYAAGRRQIDRALEMGVGTDGPVAVVVAGEGDVDAAATAVTDRLAVESIADSAPAADIIAATAPDTLTGFFDISETERAATDADLAALVCERVALLVVER
jgi:KEOPS complex subunit Cgi121